MSRLDWFTIVIVGICLVALSFLVVKTIQLMGDNDQMQTELPAPRKADDSTVAYQSDTPPATTPGAAEAEDMDLDDDELSYDPEEVEDPQAAADEDEPPVEAKPAPAKPKAATTETAKRNDLPAGTTPKGTTIPSSYSENGNYLVVAGSFSQRSNADSQIQRLKKLGYDRARVELIRGGALASALVGRYDSYEGAKSVVNQLKSQGVDAIVKTQQ